MSDPLDSAWDRIDCRFVLVGWPQSPPDELVQALTALTTFEVANPSPMALPTGVVFWRGYLTGGIGTLYHRLVPFVDEHDMAAIFSDQRLDVHVGAYSDVVVLGALRDPITLSREQFEAKLAAAAEPAELVQSFVYERLHETSFEAENTEEVIRRAQDREQAREHQIGAVRPDRIRQVPPGQLDLGLLEEASCSLQARYDPDGDLEDAELSFEMGGWRTDLLPPGQSVTGGESYDESFAWRARQWQWVDQPDQESDVETRDEAGEWVARAFGPVNLVDVLPYLPPDVEPWAIEMTELGIAALEDFVGEVPQTAADLAALREQLARARAERENR